MLDTSSSGDNAEKYESYQAGLLGSPKATIDP